METDYSHLFFKDFFFWVKLALLGFDVAEVLGCLEQVGDLFSHYFVFYLKQGGYVFLLYFLVSEELITNLELFDLAQAVAKLATLFFQ